MGTLSIEQTSAIAISFVVAGLVKGVTGLGLPTVAMALLSLLLPAPTAATLLLVPSLVTNAWQAFARRGVSQLLYRLWPMLLMASIITFLSSALLVRASGEHAKVALGAILVAYAGYALLGRAPTASPKAERWLSPLMGATTGLVTGATGVFVAPAAPYLQSLRLGREELVQALGLSFLLSTLALAAGLSFYGALHVEAAMTSVGCVVPAVAGMTIGAAIRRNVSERLFRKASLLALLGLGIDLLARGVS